MFMSVCEMFRVPTFTPKGCIISPPVGMASSMRSLWSEYLIICSDFFFVVVASDTRFDPTENVSALVLLLLLITQ